MEFNLDLQGKVRILKHLMLTNMERVVKDYGKIGVQVSGGLDSAIVYFLAMSCDVEVCPYVVSWDEEGYEYYNDARTVVGPKADLKLVEFSYDDMIAALPFISGINENANWSQVGQYFCNSRIKNDGIDIVLTGEAADELFGGYARYKALWWMDQMFQDPKLEKYHPLINKVLKSKVEIITSMIARTISYYQAQEWAKLYCDPSGELVNAMMTYEQQQCLDKILESDKQMATCHGLENIFPFATLKVREFAKTLQTKHMINAEYTKLILRALAKDLGVPDAIINEKTKKGFFIPQCWRPEGVELWDTSWFTSLMTTAAGSSRQDIASLR